jgi:hypothetical protein
MLVGGIALCGSEITDEKAAIVNSLRRKVIVVPDNDKSGAELIKAAIKYGWNVSDYTRRTSVKDLGAGYFRGNLGKIDLLKGILAREVANELKIKLLLREYLNSKI